MSTKMSLAFQHFFAEAQQQQSSRSRASTRASSPVRSETDSKASSTMTSTSSNSKKIRNAAPCPFKFGSKHKHYCKREKNQSCPYSHDEAFFLQSRKVHRCAQFEKCHGYCKLEREYCRDCARMPCRNFAECKKHIDSEYAWEAGLCDGCFYVANTQPCKTKDCKERVNPAKAPRGYCSDCFHTRNEQKKQAVLAKQQLAKKQYAESRPKRACLDCRKEMTTRKYCQKCQDKPRPCQGFECQKLAQGGKSFCDACHEVNEMYVIRRR